MADLIVGAYGNDSAAISAGAIYAFERNQGGAGNWGQIKKLTASDAASSDHFGISLR